MSDKLKNALNALEGMKPSEAISAQRENEKRLKAFLKPEETVLEALSRLSNENKQLKAKLAITKSERDELAEKLSVLR